MSVTPEMIHAGVFRPHVVNAARRITDESKRQAFVAAWVKAHAKNPGGTLLLWKGGCEEIESEASKLRASLEGKTPEERYAICAKLKALETQVPNLPAK